MLLQAVIQGENSLDDDSKTEALNQVQKIAQASKNPEDQSLQKKAKTAVSILEAIAKGLEPAAKLAEACKNILPTIIHLLGI